MNLPAFPYLTWLLFHQVHNLIKAQQIITFQPYFFQHKQEERESAPQSVADDESLQWHHKAIEESIKPKPRDHVLLPLIGN